MPPKGGAAPWASDANATIEACLGTYALPHLPPIIEHLVSAATQIHTESSLFLNEYAHCHLARLPLQARLPDAAVQQLAGVPFQQGGDQQFEAALAAALQQHPIPRCSLPRQLSHVDVPNWWTNMLVSLTDTLPITTALDPDVLAFLVDHYHRHGLPQPARNRPGTPVVPGAHLRVLLAQLAVEWLTNAREHITGLFFKRIEKLVDVMVGCPPLRGGQPRPRPLTRKPAAPPTQVRRWAPQLSSDRRRCSSTWTRWPPRSWSPSWRRACASRTPRWGWEGWEGVGGRGGMGL